MQLSVATLEDIPALCDLLAELFAQEAEFCPNREAQARGLSQILHDPAAGVVLVARNKARPIAMVNLLFTVSTALGEPVALLEDMVVAPFYRDRGVGAKMLQYAQDVSRERGVKRLTLLSDIANDAAHRFYLKQGFLRSQMVVFRRQL